MKKLITAFALLPVISFATNMDAMNLEMNKQLEKAGLPTPGSGVQVVPNGQIKMQSWQKEQFNADTQERLKKGYVERSSVRAYELMHITEQIKRTGMSDTLSTNEGDSGLHKSASEILFSYTYLGVPDSEIVELYGVAPAGAFLHSPQKGWTGAVSFFKTDFADCAYTEKNILPGQGAVRVEEASASYDVNGKVTTIEIEGSSSTGYLYDISWFDTNFYRQLECATKDYSPTHLQSVIELAKKIDKN